MTRVGLLVGLVAVVGVLLGGRAAAQIGVGQKLMIFGGHDHDVYLGCLSCPPWETDSVFNEVGQHGSEISPSSIRNPISLWGSPISPTSACNEIGSDPPVLVDKAGKYYGELTKNKARPKRTTVKAALGWLKLACADH